MDERYLTSFENQATALEYTNGGTTLVSPQVSLVGADEVVYSKEIPNESRIRFAKDETTGKLYFVVDGVYYDITELVKKSIPVPSEGYGEVDLGLPSGIKWADRNVGAETPQDNGAYFSWGNVEGVVSNGTTKMSEDYVIEQLIIAMLSIELGVEATPEQIEEFKNNPEMMEQINAIIPMVTGLISEYSFDENTYSTTLGGQYTGSELDAEHDAATVNMGSDWRMPTSAETLELVQNTDHYYIDLSGNIVAGPFDYETDSSDKGLDGSNLRSICFVKKGEGFNYNNRSNFIEFPFAGNCFGSLLGNEGLYGYVWSSSVSESSVEFARNLYFSSDGYLYGGISNFNRYYGHSVRGVRA
jgi:hypothetical protein